MTINDGGSAFPVECSYDGDGKMAGAQTGISAGWETGMTLRDWFAGQALSSIPNRSWDHLGKDENIVAAWSKLAYAVADAMLLARSPQGTTTPETK